jgi:hypothetical protein
VHEWSVAQWNVKAKIELSHSPLYAFIPDGGLRPFRG